jgi:hypothetical protein
VQVTGSAVRHEDAIDYLVNHPVIFSPFHEHAVVLNAVERGVS